MIPAGHGRFFGDSTSFNGRDWQLTGTVIALNLRTTFGFTLPEIALVIRAPRVATRCGEDW